MWSHYADKSSGFHTAGGKVRTHSVKLDWKVDEFLTFLYLVVMIFVFELHALYLHDSPQ